ncbi:MAG: hypothetical protein IJI58_03600 [Bacilli bacterium]|nr:hypothetical protein [Bacilli bacterium]
MNEIEKIVSQYDIDGQRERVFNNRQEITHLKKLMSDLKIHRDVAIYADAIDKIGYGEDIHYYLQVIRSLGNNPYVQEYSNLYEQVEMLERQKVEYYQSIQISLRDKLTYTEVPDIFVYYGTWNDKVLTRHIITPELSVYNEDNTVIFPVKELKSRGKSRRFYNQVSFKYLEELSQDKDFSIEEKKLGKVKVLSK